MCHDADQTSSGYWLMSIRAEEIRRRMTLVATTGVMHGLKTLEGKTVAVVTLLAGQVRPMRKRVVHVRERIAA